MPQSTHPPDALTPVESGELAIPLKVAFYPTTDDLAYIVEKINKSYKLPSQAQYALQAFLTVNLVGLPLVLWYYDAFVIAIGVFVLNAIFGAVFLPAVVRSDYRRYFRVMFGKIEDDIVEVELTDDGLWCRHAGDSSFHAWKNVKLLEETKNSIYFFFEHKGMAVAKSGFAYDEEKDRFLTFAKQHVRNFDTA